MVVFSIVLAAATFFPQALVGDTLPPMVLHDQMAHAYTIGASPNPPTILSFFYTQCPDLTICSNVTAKFAWLQAHLKPSERLALVEVSLDPHNDTPQRLAVYGAQIHADPRRWHMLVGDEHTTRELEDRFGVSVRRSAENGLIHSDMVAVLDGSGLLVSRFEGTEWSPEAVLETARAVSPGHSRSPLTTMLMGLAEQASALCGGTSSIPITVGEAMLVTTILAFTCYFSLRRWFCACKIR